MHEAVLKNILGDDRSAFRLRGQRHELRLHVGREAGIFFGDDVRGLAADHRPSREPSPPVSSVFTPASLQLLQQHVEMRGIAAGHFDVAAGNARRR